MTSFPTEDVRLGALLVVNDVGRSRDFYRDVLGAKVLREFEGSFCQLEFQETLLFLVAGGGPSKDKPGITFAPPTGPETVTSELVLRVPDCQSAYEALVSRGASYLTPPVKQDWGGEIRCFFRDPDGHLIEVSELLGEGPNT